MTHILKVTYRISDYTKWRQVFENTMDIRANSGLHSPIALRSLEDPSEMIIFHQVKDLQLAREFVESALVRDAIFSAGVTSAPDFKFLSLA